MKKCIKGRIFARENHHCHLPKFGHRSAPNSESLEDNQSNKVVKVIIDCTNYGQIRRQIRGQIMPITVSNLRAFSNIHQKFTKQQTATSLLITIIETVSHDTTEFKQPVQ